MDAPKEVESHRDKPELAGRGRKILSVRWLHMLSAIAGMVDDRAASGVEALQPLRAWSFNQNNKKSKRNMEK